MKRQILLTILTLSSLINCSMGVLCYNCGLGTDPPSCNPLPPPDPHSNCSICEYDINYDHEETRLCKTHDDKTHDWGCEMLGARGEISCYCHTDLCNKDYHTANLSASIRSSAVSYLPTHNWTTLVILLIMAWIL